MALSSIFAPLPAYRSPLRSLLSGYGPDGGVQPPAAAPTSPPVTTGVLTPIRNSIDTAEGISYMPGQQGRPYTGAGANASGPSVPAQAPQAGGGGSQGGGGYGGFGFDDDPILAQIRALNQRQIADAESAALAARKQAEIGYGYDPNIKYEDAATQEAARQNAFSTLAQLLFQHGERGRGLDEALNKSNLFYSGERGRQLGLEGRQYTLEQSTANQGFQQQLGQIAQMVLAARNAAQERELQGAQSAYERRLAYGGGGYGGGGSAGGGGFNADDFRRNAPAGTDVNAVYNAAQAVAPTYNGVQFVPSNIAQEGVAPPGYQWVKFVDPTGRQGSDTVLVPIR